MNQGERVEGNLNDEFTSTAKENPSNTSVEDIIEHNGKTTTNEFDVTEEDIEALGPKDLSMDMGDDEILKHRLMPVDFSANDLDIPGSELDDASEDIGAEDEENNSYSLGGDKNDDLEGDHS